jgi:hypothetical protein
MTSKISRHSLTFSWMAEQLLAGFLFLATGIPATAQTATGQIANRSTRSFAFMLFFFRQTGCFTVLALMLASGVLSAQSQEQLSNNPGAAANRAVPKLVKFLGTAKDLNGKPLTGVAGITFALYKNEQGGSALWQETQNVQADASGHYTVSLGAGRALPVELFTSGEARWLGVQVSGQTEQNRILLLSVPYALKAADAETVGGLPPSAFVLAAPPSGGNGGAASAALGSSASSSPAAIGGTGTTNFLPLWTNSTTLGNSALFQTGGKVGIGTTTPAATLDVTGGGIIRGLLLSPATGTATATKGFNSNTHDLVASAFNKTVAVNQTFRFQAEPAGNNTATASGTLNLLYGAGTATPAETGLKISNKGLFTFATGQTFPGAGTITGVTAGSGLTGGGTTGNLTLSLLSTCSANQVLRWSGTAWACASISGNGTVTSVALAAPASDFTVSGSPITGAGTLNLGWTVAPDNGNVPNAIVKRDGAGNFAANEVIANTLVDAPTVTATTVNAVDITASDKAFINTTNALAIEGDSSAPSATAIAAFATATSGAGWGVLGATFSSDADAKGVRGYASATSGFPQGVNGVSLSPTGLGVVGQGGSSTLSTTGQKFGIFSIGTMGDSALLNGIGVVATVDDAYALWAANNSSNTTAVLENSGPGHTFRALGNAGHVRIDTFGTVFATGGFVQGAANQSRMDHPFDPSGKYLSHASIESSEMLNLYTGNAVLGGDGSASVALPDWFTALNEDFRYQLTPIGGFAQLYIAEKITGNQFRIAGGHAGLEVSWQVTGVRRDAYSKAHPLVVESDKEGEERGHYVHPEAFGQPLEMGITAVERAKLHPQHAAKPAAAPVSLKGLGVTK